MFVVLKNYPCKVLSFFHTRPFHLKIDVITQDSIVLQSSKLMESFFDVISCAHFKMFTLQNGLKEIVNFQVTIFTHIMSSDLKVMHSKHEKSK